MLIISGWLWSAVVCQQIVKWWRRRESNPEPLIPNHLILLRKYYYFSNIVTVLWPSDLCIWRAMGGLWFAVIQEGNASDSALSRLNVTHMNRLANPNDRCVGSDQRDRLIAAKRNWQSKRFDETFEPLDRKIEDYRGRRQRGWHQPVTVASNAARWRPRCSRQQLEPKYSQIQQWIL